MECRFCQRSFSKGEHLRRHERSHTGARPFRCKECQRPFARQDSLARHEKLHNRKEPHQYPSPPSSLISQQTSIATSLSPMGIPEIANESSRSLPGISDQMSIAGDQNSIAGSAVTRTMQPPSADLDFDLMWPDSEDLFETLMATETTNQWQMPLTTLPISSKSLYTSNNAFASPNAFREQEPGVGQIPSGESHKAVHNVSNMVTTVSSSVTAAVEATSLSSVFLDECLHMFFCRFIPTFPVLHRATFVFRECTQPLLLNAMAIGSLYLGPKDSVAKGEALWRLAHVAVTTSWEVLITHQGPYDSCPGVQLVVTSLLAQIYGALSKNRTIRQTSQAFHALSFFWARQCPPPLKSTNLPSPSASSAEREIAWRTWAAKEIQQRALLGHYLVDGLISRMSGEAPSVRHTTNQLGLPSTEIAFEAMTADEWLNCMRSSDPTSLSFRKIISSLFLPESQNPTLNQMFSAYSLRVILEGLQSLVSDCDNEEGLIGVPTKSGLRCALAQIYESISSSPNISSPERLELFLRWHTICLDACKDSSVLCRTVCSRYNITQHVVSSKGGDEKGEMDFVSWANTEDARRALLHAIAIQEIVEQLPRGRAHVIHIPSSLFASATVYCVFSLAGQTTVNLPSVVNWQSVLSSGYENVNGNIEGLGDSGNVSETKKYIRGEYSNIFGAQGGASKNLLYELNSMQKLFRCLCSQWGIAYDMEDVIDQWISLCH